MAANFTSAHAAPTQPPADAPCPCGSGATYALCCGPLLDGAPAPTAEALMRSRYTAYALRNEDHLFRTWHPRTRPAPPLASAGTLWLGLEIQDAVAGGEDDDVGEVAFVARYRKPDGTIGELRERSRFVRRAGRWVYIDAL